MLSAFCDAANSDGGGVVIFFLQKSLELLTGTLQGGGRTGYICQKHDLIGMEIVKVIIKAF